jgi:hypothetical protein
MKIHPVGAEFHADRQTDRHDEANNLLLQFCKGPKKPTRHQDVFSFHCLNCSLTNIEKAAEENVDQMGMK